MSSSTARRALAATALFTSGVLLLTGCGRSDGPATPEAAATLDDSPATGEITIWAFDNEGKTLTQLAEQFEADNPDATVTVTPVSADELPRKLDTAVASGQVPDIVQPSTGLQSYVAAGAIAPVPDGVFDEGEYFQSAVDALTFDDTVFGMPWYVTVQSFYYRADLLEQAGLEVPTTWEEQHEYAQAMVDGGAGSGYWVGSTGTFAWQTILPLIYQAGGGVIDDDGAFTLDTPEVEEALAHYQSFFTDGLSDPTFVPTAPGEIEARFADGDIASYSTGSYSYNFALEALGGDESKLGAATLPAGPDGSAGYLGGSGLSVMADSDNQDSAWKFLRSISTLEGQQAAYDVSGVLPAMSGAWESGALADSELGAVLAEQVEQSEPLPKILTWTEIRDVIATYGEQLARGVITPEDAAAGMQADAERIGTGEAS